MNDEQLLRYSRHILLDGFDIDGQQRLLNQSALIIGAGGLGCPAAMYLAASGLGQITLADDDRVELSNLQRQIGHSEKTLGQNKAQSLKQRLQAINSTISITSVEQRIDEHNIQPLVQEADIVLDCSDNFRLRFLVNRTCFALKKPLVSGAAIRTTGHIAALDFRQSASPCYACLYDESVVSDESCAHNGVLAPLVGIIGSWQAAYAIQLLSDFGENIAGYLHQIDLLAHNVQRFRIKKDHACPVCCQNT